MAPPPDALLLYFGTARKPVLDGYSRALAWVSADPRARLRISRQQESDWRRIAKLGDAWGLKLEALQAPFALVQWVAGPIRVCHAVAEERFRAAVIALEAAARAGRPLTNRQVRELVRAQQAREPDWRRRPLRPLEEAPPPARELRPLRPARGEELKKAS